MLIIFDNLIARADGTIAPKLCITLCLFNGSNLAWSSVKHFTPYVSLTANVYFFYLILFLQVVCI